MSKMSKMMILIREWIKKQGDLSDQTFNTNFLYLTVLLDSMQETQFSQYQKSFELSYSALIIHFLKLMNIQAVFRVGLL